MHRRARHLTGRAAGASFHYDARRLSLTDGTGVDTWTDLAGTNDATQTTSTNRPTFRTNILNGNPVVRFDGVNDWLNLTTTVNPAAEYLEIILFKTNKAKSPTVAHKTTTTGYPYANFMYDGGSPGTYLMYSMATGYSFTSVPTTPLAYNIWATYTSSSSNAKMYENGVSKTTTVTNVSTGTEYFSTIGARDSDSTWLDGDIAAVIHIRGTGVDSLQKRFEHAMGFSFKTACS